jgi:hypothetical protein
MEFSRSRWLRGSAQAVVVVLATAAFRRETGSGGFAAKLTRSRAIAQ